MEHIKNHHPELERNCGPPQGAETRRIGRTALKEYQAMPETVRADLRAFEILSVLSSLQRPVKFAVYAKAMADLGFSNYQAHAALDDCGCSIRGDLTIDFSYLRESVVPSAFALSAK